ncbi:Uncharacterized protein APZ42_010000 [Daphnia magna]|uniref:Uncharacterized protein n=1 Tax=Daphnia magna TaxID=35525 RepID=A0A164DMH9_9CRUS|nr:Uncharacterized protein APZ42_010000 [Daphnia magna]
MQAREVCHLNNSMLSLLRLHELIPINSHPRVFLKCRMQYFKTTLKEVWNFKKSNFEK